MNKAAMKMLVLGFLCSFLLDKFQGVELIGHRGEYVYLFKN